MYKIYFVDKKGQGYIYVEGKTKEEAIKNANAELKKATIITIERA